LLKSKCRYRDRHKAKVEGAVRFVQRKAARSGEQHSRAHRQREQDGEAKRAKLSPPSKQTLFLSLDKLLFKPHRNTTFPFYPGYKRISQTSPFFTTLMSDLSGFLPPNPQRSQNVHRCARSRRTAEHKAEGNADNIWLKAGKQPATERDKRTCGL